MARGKKEITLNFRKADDMQRLKQMCLESDVLLDPYRPGALEGMGLDPVQLIKVFYRLIFLIYFLDLGKP